MELNVLALVIGTVSDPAAQAVATSVARALSAPDAGSTLLAPVLIAAGEAQGGPPGVPATGGAELVPGSIGVQLIPRLVIAPSGKRVALSARGLAAWAVAIISTGSALGAVAVIVVALRRWLLRKRAAVVVAPLPIQKEPLPLQREVSDPFSAPTADTGATASEPSNTSFLWEERFSAPYQADDWGGARTASEEQRPRALRAATEARVTLRSPPSPSTNAPAPPSEKVVAPKAPHAVAPPKSRPMLPPLRAAVLREYAPPPLPHNSDAIEDLCTDQTLKRAMSLLKKTQDRGAALLGKPKELAALQQGLILRPSSDRVWWSSPHAAKGKAPATAKGFRPIERERLAHKLRGEQWPPAAPKEVLLTPEEVEGIGGHAAANDLLRKAALLARSKSRPH